MISTTPLMANKVDTSNVICSIKSRARIPKTAPMKVPVTLSMPVCKEFCNEDFMQIIAAMAAWIPSLIPINWKKARQIPTATAVLIFRIPILYRGSLCFSPFRPSTTFTFLLSKLGDSCTDNTILQLGCAICVICMGSLRRKGGGGNLDFVESSEFEIYKKNM